MRSLFIRLAMLATGVLLVAAPGAFAGTPTVDPSTLQPEPPPGASCRLDGRFVICQTEFHEPLDAEPVLELPCGTLYETSRDDREGIRWYEDGLIVARFVSRRMSGYWTLSPTGDYLEWALGADFTHGPLTLGVSYVDTDLGGGENVDAGVLVSLGVTF